MRQQSGDVVLNDILSQGGIAAAREFDLGDTSNIAKLLDICESELDPVDILINNHDHCILETFDPDYVTHELLEIFLTNAEGIDRHFAVNARACALMMREYLQRYIKREAQSGRIINLTTVLGHSKNVSYAASKRALVSYSMSAAQEMGKYGITVNVVCPDATQTGYINPINTPPIVPTALSAAAMKDDFLPMQDVIATLGSEVVLAVGQLSA